MSNRLFYSILDRGETLVLQESELVRTCGGWKYFRCPKSGFEWHVNGIYGYRASPIEAWHRYCHLAYIRLHFRAEDMYQRTGEDLFREICLIVRQIEVARREVAKLEEADEVNA